jgi:hypothetical protein
VINSVGKLGVPPVSVSLLDRLQRPDCSTYGERRGVYTVSVRKSQRKRPLGRPMRRWKNYINVDFQDVGCGGTDWVGLGEDKDRCRALVNAVMNLRVP